METKEQPKYIDISRIPLICEDIRHIHKYMERIDEHIKRVEPMIMSYEENQAAKKVISKTANIIIKIAGLLTALGIIGLALKEWLK